MARRLSVSRSAVTPPCPFHVKRRFRNDSGCCWSRITEGSRCSLGLAKSTIDRFILANHARNRTRRFRHIRTIRKRKIRVHRLWWKVDETPITNTDWKPVLSAVQFLSTEGMPKHLDDRHDQSFDGTSLTFRESCRQALSGSRIDQGSCHHPPARFRPCAWIDEAAHWDGKRVDPLSVGRFELHLCALGEESGCFRT